MKNEHEGTSILDTVKTVLKALIFYLILLTIGDILFGFRTHVAYYNLFRPVNWLLFVALLYFFLFPVKGKDSKE